MAVLTMLLTQDRCTKNFLIYRDVNTTKWQLFGYDLKSAMNTAAGFGGTQASDYCTLTCPQWNSPLYCDRAHPQVSLCLIPPSFLLSPLFFSYPV